jgi:hypothetical protein
LVRALLTSSNSCDYETFELNFSARRKIKKTEKTFWKKWNILQTLKMHKKSANASSGAINDHFR